VSEGSAAAGVRRIEAVTGRGAYELIARRFKALKQAAGMLAGIPEGVPEKVFNMQEELNQARKQIISMRQEMALQTFEQHLSEVVKVRGEVNLLAIQVPGADAETLRKLADRFRQDPQYGNTVGVFGSSIEGHPLVITAVDEHLVKRGLHAGQLAKHVAAFLEGSGGGKPTLAQAGGRDASRLAEALGSVKAWVEKQLGPAAG
jgi:alanyl-tRNA synthetase